MPPSPSISSFYDDPDGDLVLECSNGIRSRVKSFKLRAAAQVFDDMLQPDTGGSGDKTDDGLPLIKVDECSDDFGRFLRYALQPQPADEDCDFSSTKRILILCDKYDAPQCATLLVSLLWDLAGPGGFPTQVFALAAIHNHLRMARYALSHFDRMLPVHPQVDTWLSCDKDKVVYGIPKTLFLRIPPLALFNLHSVVQQVNLLPPVDRAARWKELAKTFKLD